MNVCVGTSIWHCLENFSVCTLYTAFKVQKVCFDSAFSIHSIKNECKIFVKNIFSSEVKRNRSLGRMGEKCSTFIRFVQSDPPASAQEQNTNSTTHGFSNIQNLDA